MSLDAEERSRNLRRVTCRVPNFFYLPTAPAHAHAAPFIAELLVFLPSNLLSSDVPCDRIRRGDGLRDSSPITRDLDDSDELYYSLFDNYSYFEVYGTWKK